MHSNTEPPTVNARQVLARALETVFTNLLSQPEPTRRSFSRPQIMVGLFLVVFGLWIGRDHGRLVLFGIKTEGKLVGYQEQRFQRSPSSYMVSVVQFQVENKTVRFNDWLDSNFRVPRGGLVPILYDPKRPSNAMIDRPVMNWIPWAPIILVGALLLISGLRLRWQ